MPTATFRILFVFVVLSNERRRVVHFGVSEQPTQEWTMQQMREAFPWDQVPRYVLRDRDAIFGREFAAMTRNMGTEEVLTAPSDPGVSHCIPAPSQGESDKSRDFCGYYDTRECPDREVQEREANQP